MASLVETRGSWDLVAFTSAAGTSRSLIPLNLGHASIITAIFLPTSMENRGGRSSHTSFYALKALLAFKFSVAIFPLIDDALSLSHYSQPPHRPNVGTQ